MWSRHYSQIMTLPISKMTRELDKLINWINSDNILFYFPFTISDTTPLPHKASNNDLIPRIRYIRLSPPFVIHLSTRRLPLSFKIKFEIYKNRWFCRRAKRTSPSPTHGRPLLTRWLVSSPQPAWKKYTPHPFSYQSGTFG